MFMCHITYHRLYVRSSWAEVNARTTNSWPQKRHSNAYKINIKWIIYAAFNIVNLFIYYKIFLVKTVSILWLWRIIIR